MFTYKACGLSCDDIPATNIMTVIMIDYYCYFHVGNIITLFQILSFYCALTEFFFLVQWLFAPVFIQLNQILWTLDINTCYVIF